MKLKPPLVAALLLAACEIPQTGLSTAYVRPAEPIDVVMPANAPSIRQQFRPAPSRDRYAEGHYGIDIVGPTDLPILAPVEGRVFASFFEPLYGAQMILEHGPDASGRRYRTRYWHMASKDVDVGDIVQRGQKLGGLGRTGMLSGGILHLHFEVMREERPGRFVPLDPHLLWIDGVGRVTCFQPDRSYQTEPLRLTYPVACR